MFRVPENTNVPKKIFQTIAILLSLCVSINKIIAANNQLVLLKELFDTHIFYYAFQNPISINELQKNYYNFSLLSQEYNKKTKRFWKTHWHLIMEHVCADYRYTRMYFATIFYYQNKKIKEYFKEHVTIYQTLFYNSLGHQDYLKPANKTWLDNKDPNFTTFGQESQMSFLEMCFKSYYYPTKHHKIKVCQNLIKNGARYDIWIYQGISNIDYISPLMQQETDIVKKLQGRCLLSEYIAMHHRCTLKRATEIMQKGTVAQDLFIKRFPTLAIHKKDSIQQPPLPDDFAAKHHCSLFRLQGLMLDNIFIAKKNPYARASYDDFFWKKSVLFSQDLRNNGVTYFLHCDPPSDKKIRSLYRPDYRDSDGLGMDDYIKKSFYDTNGTLSKELKQKKEAFIKDLYFAKMKFYLGKLYYIWLAGFHCIKALKSFLYLFKKFLKVYNEAYDVK